MRRLSDSMEDRASRIEMGDRSISPLGLTRRPVGGRGLKVSRVEEKSALVDTSDKDEDESGEEEC